MTVLVLSCLANTITSRLSLFGLCMLLKFKPKQLVTNKETPEVVYKMATSGDCVTRMW